MAKHYTVVGCRIYLTSHQTNLSVCDGLCLSLCHKLHLSACSRLCLSVLWAMLLSVMDYMTTKHNPCT